MFLGKKGILPVFVLLFTIICLGAALFYLSESLENQKGVIGDKQLGVLKMYSDAQQDKIYSELLLEQNFEGFLVEFASDGVMYNDQITIDRYVYWKRGEINCYPNFESIKRDFSLFINDQLDDVEYSPEILFGNDGIMKVKMISSNDYNFEEDSLKVVYKPANDYNFESDIDIGLFNSIISDIEEIAFVVDECGNDNDCWADKANFYWEQDNNLFKVEVVSGIIETESFGEKEVILKAAVDFNEVNPLLGEDFICSV